MPRDPKPIDYDVRVVVEPDGTHKWEEREALASASGSEAIATLQRVEGTALINYEVKVRVLAIAEGYAMVRRKGCSPFVLEMKRIKMPPNDQTERQPPAALTTAQKRYE